MISAAASRRERHSLLVSPSKPEARGWIHAIAMSLALANAIVLTALALMTGIRLVCLVFGTSSVVLFGYSAVYHLGKQPAEIEPLPRGMDHSNTFLLIAGTYTPLMVMVLMSRIVTCVLVIVWADTLGGIFLTVSKPDVLRWLSMLFRLLLDWAAVRFLPEYWTVDGPIVVWPILAGGITYSAGTVSCGLRQLNPRSHVWGFYGPFHACTLLAYTCQVVTVRSVAMVVK